MGVYINMEMPKNCFDCPLETDYGFCGYYDIFAGATIESPSEGRLKECPLIEIPKHGRLIIKDGEIVEQKVD